MTPTILAVAITGSVALVAGICLGMSWQWRRNQPRIDELETGLRFWETFAKGIGGNSPDSRAAKLSREFDEQYERVSKSLAQRRDKAL